MPRLLGTETEYAIRFSPSSGQAHPGNQALFTAIRDAVSEQVHTRPGRGLIDHLRGRVFLENGGSLYYEFIPRADQGGLIEAATPECRTAAQLLLYQRAQDWLLAAAAVDAQRRLGRRGVRGELALLKNCRDAQGHVYGAQESYEVPIVDGLGLALWWLAIGLALPFALVSAVLYWLLLAVVFTVTSVVAIVAIPILVLRALSSGESEVKDPGATWLPAALGGLDLVVGFTLALPSTLIVATAARLLAFRPYRRGLTAFWISRCVISGAGTLLDDGFALSEKALAMRRMSRWTVFPGDRGVLEIGHLMKPLHALTWLDWRAVVGLLGRRQRLQLGLSDANLCDVAELLKLGTTDLVLDLVEAGQLGDAPQLADPIAALHAVVRDPTLTVRVPLRGGGEVSALELQRFYQRRAVAWLAEAPAVSLEAHELAAQWGEVLDRLETDPGSLFGQLDWVTKKRLLDDADDLSADARKKIDLRYHELGGGYHAWLEADGLSPRLVADDEVTRAEREPPGDTPALQRGRLVRALALSGTDARFGWTHAHVRGRVIRFDETRRKRE